MNANEDGGSTEPPEKDSPRYFVLESFPDKERRIGAVLERHLANRGCDTVYREFASVEDLTSILAEIHDFAQKTSRPVVLHISCHGNERGVVPSGGGLMTWREFREHFRRIYLASGQRLFVTLASCKGFEVSRLIAMQAPCPFSCLCGSKEVISRQDSFDGFSLFYDRIIAGAAVNVAQHAVDIDVPTLKLLAYTTDALFEIMCNNYRRDHMTPENIEKLRAAAKRHHAAKIASDPEVGRRLEETYTYEALERRLGDRRTVFFS